MTLRTGRCRRSQEDHGRTKTEVRDKLRELHSQVENGVRPRRQLHVGLRQHPSIPKALGVSDAAELGHERGGCTREEVTEPPTQLASGPAELDE